MEKFMKKIVLTGGGTAGHVTPNIALLPALKEAGYENLSILHTQMIKEWSLEIIGNIHDNPELLEVGDDK